MGSAASRRHFRFLFLGLQHGREGDLEGRPGRHGGSGFTAGTLGGRGSHPTAETYSQVVQMGLKLQNTAGGETEAGLRQPHRAATPGLPLASRGPAGRSSAAGNLLDKHTEHT